MARRSLCGFELPYEGTSAPGDASQLNGAAGGWTHDASYAPPGPEYTAAARTGFGFGFRRSEGIGNITQLVQQGGLSPSASVHTLFQQVRLRLRRLPTVEMQVGEIIATNNDKYVFSVDTAGFLRCYTKLAAGAYPGTFLFGGGSAGNPLAVGTWYPFRLLATADTLLTGGMILSLTIYAPFAASTVSTGSPVLANLFSSALWGAQGFPGGAASLLEVDFDDWVMDDVGDLTTFDANVLAANLVSAQITDTNRVETRRPIGLGLYTAWGSSGILDYRARWGVPSGTGGGVGLTANVSGAKQTYNFGTPRSQGVAGGVRAIRLSLYMLQGQGTNQFILRLNGVETLYPFTGGNLTWKSQVVDFGPGGLNPDTLVECGIQKDASATPATIQSMLVSYETVFDVPLPPTLQFPTEDSIHVAHGQYVGTGTATEVTVGFVPHWLSLWPVSAAGQGIVWSDADMAASPHNTSVLNGLAIAVTTPTGFTTVEAGAGWNQAGVTYQWVAVRDPQHRGLTRGSRAHGAGDSTDTEALANAAFLPEFLWARIQHYNTAIVPPGYVRGPGHSGLASSPFSGGAATVTDAIMALTTGSFDTGLQLHRVAPGITWTAWRTIAFFNRRLWDVLTYTGDGGGGTRTIPCNLGGRNPLWALVQPHNGAAHVRPPGLDDPHSYTIGGVDQTTAIVGGGPDQIKVGVALNTLNIVYEVLVLAGDLTGVSGWTAKRPPGSPPSDYTDSAPIPACPVPEPAPAGGGLVCAAPTFGI